MPIRNREATDLHIPHKEWADNNRDELENYLAIERWSRGLFPTKDVLVYSGPYNITTTFFVAQKDSVVDFDGYGYDGGQTISFTDSAAAGGGDGFTVKKTGLYYVDCFLTLDAPAGGFLANGFANVFLTRLDDFFDDNVFIFDHISYVATSNNFGAISGGAVVSEWWRLNAHGIYPMPAGSIWGFEGNVCFGAGGSVNMAGSIATVIYLGPGPIPKGPS